MSDLAAAPAANRLGTSCLRHLPDRANCGGGAKGQSQYAFAMIAWASGDPPHVCLRNAPACRCGSFITHGAQAAAAYVPIGLPLPPGPVLRREAGGEAPVPRSTHTASLFVLWWQAATWVREQCDSETVFNQRFFAEGPNGAGRYFGLKARKLRHFRAGATGEVQADPADGRTQMNMVGGRVFNPQDSGGVDDKALRFRLGYLVRAGLLHQGGIERAVKLFKALGGRWVPCTKPGAVRGSVRGRKVGASGGDQLALISLNVLPAAAAGGSWKRTAVGNGGKQKRRRQATVDDGGAAAGSSGGQAKSAGSGGQAKSAGNGSHAAPAPAAPAAPAAAPPAAGPSGAASRAASGAALPPVVRQVLEVGGMVQLVKIVRASEAQRAVCSLLADRGNLVCMSVCVAVRAMDQMNLPCDPPAADAAAAAVSGLVADGSPPHCLNQAGGADSERAHKSWMGDFVTVRAWLLDNTLPAGMPGSEAEMAGKATKANHDAERCVRVARKCQAGEGDNRMNVGLAAAMLAMGEGAPNAAAIRLQMYEALTPSQ